MSELTRLATAAMFLTRLPTGSLASAEPAELARSTRYFPLVGFGVGVLLAIGLSILLKVFPASVALGLMLLLSIRLTGAFHEDGLADVADSAGAFQIDRKLEIMRDSRLGTYGSLALILLVLIKLLSLWELSQLDLRWCLGVLVAAHVLSRWSSVWLMVFIPYARPEAANKVVAEGVTLRRLAESTVWAFALLCVLAWWVSPAILLLLPMAWLVTVLAGRHFSRSFGGITGDCLGAANQLVETAVFLGTLAALTWH